MSLHLKHRTPMSSERIASSIYHLFGFVLVKVLISYNNIGTPQSTMPKIRYMNVLPDGNYLYIFNSDYQYALGDLTSIMYRYYTVVKPPVPPISIQVIQTLPTKCILRDSHVMKITMNQPNIIEEILLYCNINNIKLNMKYVHKDVLKIMDVALSGNHRL